MLLKLAIFTLERDYPYERMIHLQNPSKLREKQMDKVGQILHPKLRRIIILSDVNYPTDNLSQMDNLSLV